MPTLSDTALCLRQWEFSETSQTVSLFSREHGMIRALAKGARRAGGRFSGGLDVLTRGRMVAIVKPGRDLSTLTEWHVERLYRPIRQDLAANRAAFFMADLVHHLLTDHDPHPDLFDAVTEALERLGGSTTPGVLLLGVQWRILDETGYRPELWRDAETGAMLSEDEATLAFSPRAGGVVADVESPERWRVRKATVELLRCVAEHTNMMEPDDATVRRANRLLAAYVREIIGKDLPTARWVFSDANLGMS